MTIRGRLYSAHSFISLHRSAPESGTAHFCDLTLVCGLTESSVKVLIVCFPEPFAYQLFPCYAQNGKWNFLISHGCEEDREETEGEVQ
jgi:hypothetical protein